MGHPTTRERSIPFLGTQCTCQLRPKAPPFCQWHVRLSVINFRSRGKMSTVLSVITLVGTAAAAVMWIVNTFRHRSHLSQCVQDLQRHHRLDRSLIGCVNEMERILDNTPPQVSDAEIPEALVGHARYLFGLRQEGVDNVVRLSRHAVRLRWPDGNLARATLAGKRCDVAHGALIRAFQTLGDATREYERGIATALLQRGDSAEVHALRSPVRLLNEQAAEEAARLREVCAQALTHTADACNLRFQSHAVFDTKWPVRRSEMLEGRHRPLQRGSQTYALDRVRAAAAPSRRRSVKLLARGDR